METLGSRLKLIRTSKKLTQLDFGKCIGVTKQAIANVESSHSNPSIDFLSKLIEIFNVNINWLISGHGEMFTNIVRKTLPSDDEFELKMEAFLKKKGIL